MGAVGEWIEIELDEEPTKRRRLPIAADAKPPRQPGGRLDWRQRRALAITAGAVVVAGVGWAVSRSDDDGTSAAQTTVAPASTAPPGVTLADVDTTAADPPPTTRPRPTTPPGPPVVVAAGSGPMLPSPTGLELVALTTRGDLLDIDVDSGTLVTTDIPGGGSGAPAFIVADTDVTFVQRWDVSTVVVVPRGMEPSEVSDSAELVGGAYPGPEPGTRWAQTYEPRSGALTALELVRFEGEPLGRRIEVAGWWPLQSDMRGGVLVQRGGAVYSVNDTGSRLLAPGDLVGAGDNHLVVRTCDATMACTLSVVDWATLEQRPVPDSGVAARATNGGEGTSTATVAPDGTAMVVVGLEGDFTPSLLDLNTGEHVSLSSVPSTLSVAWSDDSRYALFTRNTALWAYDRQTGAAVPLEGVPPIVNFVSRP
jgi:hypothetical protein